MDWTLIKDFINAHPLGVVSTVSPEGDPSAALVGMIPTESREILFCVKGDGRTLRNIRVHPRVAIVFSNGKSETFQVEGDAHIPGGDDLLQNLHQWRERNPDSGILKPNSSLVLVSVNPTWARHYIVTDSGSCVNEIEFD